mgnify:CR=1 FL=1
MPMTMTVEQFLSFSESEQLQTVKELNDTGNVKTIIDVLTSVGIENLSISLLGELGRAYNNNGNEKESKKREKLKIKELETDVLIIGGGTAGCYAAITIGKNSDLSVIVAEKANIKRSGCYCG